MELISDYMRNEQSRHMLNDLTGKTFGFDFEGWVTGGCFDGGYIPYSLIENGMMLSNVSANKMQFDQNGTVKNYIQIGTVMTDADHRGQGLAAQLMQHVISTYENECDGIYLFANLGATGFYEKMGFVNVNQYRYYLKDEYLKTSKSDCKFEPVKGRGKGLRNKYLDYVRNSVRHSSFEQINKYGLQMFYTSGLDNVYYAEDIDCFIVMEQEEDTVISSVLSSKRVLLTDVIKHIDVEGRCRLGYVPLGEDKDLCVAEEFNGGDEYRLYYRGAELGAIEKDKLYFPDLSHA